MIYNYFYKLYIQWNLINPDADNLEASPSGHNFIRMRSPCTNTHHCVHGSSIQKTHWSGHNYQGTRYPIKEVPLYFISILTWSIELLRNCHISDMLLQVLEGLQLTLELWWELAGHPPKTGGCNSAPAWPCSHIVCCPVTGQEWSVDYGWG